MRTDHFQDPYFRRIRNREGFSLACITILLHKRRHHLNSFPGSLGALKSDIDQTALYISSLLWHLSTVVNNGTRLTSKLFQTSKSGLADGELKLVDVSNNTVGDRSLSGLVSTKEKQITVTRT